MYFFLSIVQRGLNDSFAVVISYGSSPCCMDFLFPALELSQWDHPNGIVESHGMADSLFLYIFLLILNLLCIFKVLLSIFGCLFYIPTRFFFNFLITFLPFFALFFIPIL